jgi:hypothetical protein
MLLRRLAVVVLPALVAVPLLSGTASASCTDDLLATNLGEGNTEPTYSPHWYELDYVQTQGTATVHVYGDALVSDATLYAADWVSWVALVGGNASDAALEFEDCVAG